MVAMSRAIAVRTLAARPARARAASSPRCRRSGRGCSPRCAAARAAPFPFDAPRATRYYFARNAVCHGARLLGLEGREVLVPAYHHGVEVGALVAAGAVPRFVRVDGRMRLDLDDLERADRAAHPRASTSSTTPGSPSRWTSVRALARRRGLLVVEDCALSLLAAEGTRPLGSTGHLGVFCFYKTLPVPNGGALVVNDPAVAGAPPRARAPRRSPRRSRTRPARCSRTSRCAPATPGEALRGAACGAPTRSRAAPRASARSRPARRRFDPAHVDLGMSALSVARRAAPRRRRRSSRPAGATTSSCSAGCATGSPPVFARAARRRLPALLPAPVRGQGRGGGAARGAAHRDGGLLARGAPALPGGGVPRGGGAAPARARAARPPGPRARGHGRTSRARSRRRSRERAPAPGASPSDDARPAPARGRSATSGRALFDAAAEPSPFLSWEWLSLLVARVRRAARACGSSRRATAPGALAGAARSSSAARGSLGVRRWQLARERRHRRRRARRARARRRRAGGPRGALARALVEAGGEWDVARPRGPALRLADGGRAAPRAGARAAASATVERGVRLPRVRGARAPSRRTSPASRAARPTAGACAGSRASRASGSTSRRRPREAPAAMEDLLRLHRLRWAAEGGSYGHPAGRGRGLPPGGGAAPRGARLAAAVPAPRGRRGDRGGLRDRGRAPLLLLPVRLRSGLVGAQPRASSSSAAPIEDAYARGLADYDFLRGTEPYKLDWAVGPPRDVHAAAARAVAARRHRRRRARGVARRRADAARAVAPARVWEALRRARRAASRRARSRGRDGPEEGET